MQSLLTEQMRLLMILVVCGLLWSLESIVPLYRFQNSRVRHAVPNVALTVMLVLTNLALSFASASLAEFSVRHSFGLFFITDLSASIQAVLGVFGFGPFRLLRPCPAAQILAGLAVPSRASLGKHS